MRTEAERSTIEPTMESRAEFELVYDGPEMATGQIDVRDLSPALIGAADLLAAANRRANGQEAYSSLKIKARPRPGSFGVEVILDIGLWQAAKDLLTGADWTTAGELWAIAVGGKGSYIWLKKRLRGNRPEIVRELPEGRVEVRVDGEVTVTHRIAIDMLSDQKANNAASEMLRPLDRTGIDTFRVKDAGGAVVEEVTDADLPYFEAEEAGEPEIQNAILDQTQPALLEIIKPAFERDLRWMVTDGTKRFGALMKDEAFQDKVTRRVVAFRHGDILRVRLRVVVGRSLKGGLSQRHEIVEVLGFLDEGQQHPMSFEGPPLVG